MTGTIPAQHRERAQAIANQFGALPHVTAVALAGSITGPFADAHSDLDIYVYSTQLPALEARADIARASAGADHPSIELDRPFWGPEDAWKDAQSGLDVEIIHRAPGWIADQLNHLLDHHRASIGYSTAFWYNVRHSIPLVDPNGWYAALQTQAAQPYPEALRRNIIRLNYPLLRDTTSSFHHQIELAIARRDRVSVNHRIAALLASYFDVLFALNRQPHPGEKRLIPYAERLCTQVPEHMADDLDALLCSAGSAWDHNATMQHLDRLLDRFDTLLIATGCLLPDGTVM